MIAWLAALALAPALDTTVEVQTSDDVWVYPHAFDQTGDPFLRIWGVEGRSVGTLNDEEGAWSFSLLRFPLAEVPSKTLKSATVVVTHNAALGVTAEQAKDAPIEVRAAKADFQEKTWNWSMMPDFRPAKEETAILGSGAPTPVQPGQPFAVEIELDLERFGPVLSSARAGGFLGLALTAKVDPAELGQAGVYKVFSRSAEQPERRPKLVLVFQD